MMTALIIKIGLEKLLQIKGKNYTKDQLKANDSSDCSQNHITVLEIGKQ